MRPRCEWEIIYDMLDVIKDRELATPIHLIWEGAKIKGRKMRRKYTRVLEKTNLVTLKALKAEITPKGIQFLIFFEEIGRMLRAGVSEQNKTQNGKIAG